jgi:FkbH-like protein
MPGVTLFDLDYLSARYGLERALDTKSYCLTKQPFAFDFLPPYCHALARSVAQSCGLTQKCAVLDLDGTLWGGTLAEDGIERLVLGPDSAEGEAFLAFQRYLKQLKERGVLLAVCSKNDEQTARRAFGELPHMALTLADIACFVANWQNKAENVAQIAQHLNLGLDALVFVDNSPEERHLIRLQLPQVSVVELPEDPAEFVRALDDGAYFEISELTEEALLRTASLVQNEARGQAQALFVDYDAYLQSLRLSAEIKPISGAAFERCAELVLRSNQFNLRSARHSEHELRAFLARAGNCGFCVSLGDRFGHYGIISVALLETRADALFIDTWLMSCRVLKKGVEALVFEEIVAAARRHGLVKLAAEYLPTAKNGMVASLLSSFGFTPEVPEHAPAGRYRLDLDAARAPAEHFIHVKRTTEP